MSTFQSGVHAWMLECFGAEIAADVPERNHRFLEEALELVQAAGCAEAEALELVAYVYGRPVGEIRQEVGGVLVTLAALCTTHNVDMEAAGEAELVRVWTKLEQIRAKQSGKPKVGPLPGPSVPAAPSRALADVAAERRRQIEVEGWSLEADDSYQAGDLANAAGCYALTDPAVEPGRSAPYGWPWASRWWKPTNRRRDLVKAGALILAEIERLDRLAARGVETTAEGDGR